MQIRIRVARKQDAYALWRWRNHPDVRKWCLNSNKISYKAHKEWLDRKMTDSNTKIYIAEGEKKQKIGQARFDIDSYKKAYINVNLNPDYFSKGLGSRLIKLTTESFLKERMKLIEDTSPAQPLSSSNCSLLSDCRSF